MASKSRLGSYTPSSSASQEMRSLNNSFIHVGATVVSTPPRIRSLFLSAGFFITKCSDKLWLGPLASSAITNKSYNTVGIKISQDYLGISNIESAPLVALRLKNLFGEIRYSSIAKGLYAAFKINNLRELSKIVATGLHAAFPDEPEKIALGLKAVFPDEPEKIVLGLKVVFPDRPEKLARGLKAVFPNEPEKTALGLEAVFPDEPEKIARGLKAVFPDEPEKIVLGLKVVFPDRPETIVLGLKAVFPDYISTNLKNIALESNAEELAILLQMLYINDPRRIARALKLFYPNITAPQTASIFFKLFHSDFGLTAFRLTALGIANIFCDDAQIVEAVKSLDICQGDIRSYEQIGIGLALFSKSSEVVDRIFGLLGWPFDKEKFNTRMSVYELPMVKK